MRDEPIRIAQVMGIMNRGGVEAVVMNYYRALDRTKIQFDFFVDETSSFPQREEIERLDGRCYLVPSYSRPLLYIRTLTRLFRQNRYGIVHSQINTMGLFPLFAARLAGVPVRICHNHSTAHAGEGKKTLMKYLLRPFARVFATDCFACAEAAARWMFGNRRFDRGAVQIMPNAIELSRYLFSQEDRDSIRAELSIGASDFVVGHIGRFTYQKNHAFLLRVFQSLLQSNPDSILLLAGDGELLERTEALAEELGVMEQVRFLSSRSDANRLYSAVDVFCLPSFYEGLPVVMVEALANGLTCVVSTNVTSELNSYPVVQIPLFCGEDAWAETLASVARTHESPWALAERFDIRNVSVWLESYYLRRLNVQG